MFPDDFRNFLSRLEESMLRITKENIEADAPASICKARYIELLETMRACGELDDYEDSYYIDPATGILCARVSLRIPRDPCW
jgi:hypothetical protein